MPDTTATAAVARRPSPCLSPASLGGCQCSISVSPPPNRPDPAIYSQAPLVAANQAVTWASPDIAFYAPPTYDGTHWQFIGDWLWNYALVTVRNRSTAVGAINTLVSVSRSGIGIGLPRRPLTAQLVSLAPGEQRQLTVPIGLTVVDLDGGLDGMGFETGDALFVDISHPYDAETDNNHGECITSIILRRTPSSSTFFPVIPDRIPIQLGNTTASVRDYVLSVLPNSIAAAVSPTEVSVAPGNIVTASLTYTRPQSGGVDPGVTLIARDPGGNFLGGMTVQFYFE